MPWRLQTIQIFDIVLRVPPLFVVDAVLNKTFLIPWIPKEMSFFGPVFILWLLIVLVSFLGSGVIFVLGTRLLIDTYYFILSIVMLWLSYQINTYYLQLAREFDMQEDILFLMKSQPRTILTSVLAQILLAHLYNCWRLDLPFNQQNVYTGMTRQVFRRCTYLCFLMVIICRLMALPNVLLVWMPLVSILMPILEMIFTLLTHIRPLTRLLYRGYLMMKYMIRTYGIQNFLELQWTRLHVPRVLRIFWITRTLCHVIFFVTECLLAKVDEGEEGVLTWDDGKAITRQLLISGCETVIALLGMTSIVSLMTHYVGHFMANFLKSDSEEDKNMGTVSAILFFILALQTGLTGLEPDKRIVRLYRNFCLLSTAILHFIHGMVNPLLMSLSAQRNSSVSRHARVLIMCLFLIVTPSCFLVYLWMRHSLSTWLLAVTAFSIEVIIKVLISLLVYILFMIDAYRETFWEKLDDYVYYIKSTGNSIEFIFGIFLFCNGAWIMVFESGGTIRAIMMCIHAYFNIWMQAKEGWKVFMKRRTAVKKINSLPLASADRLRVHNDVCAICYQELNSARVTRCNHFFHGVCLRKWLYVQDCCPLCHELIYNPEPTEDVATESPNENAPEENFQGEHDPNQNQLVLNHVNQEEPLHNEPVEHQNQTAVLSGGSHGNTGANELLNHHDNTDDGVLNNRRTAHHLHEHQD